MTTFSPDAFAGTKVEKEGDLCNNAVDIAVKPKKSIMQKSLLFFVTTFFLVATSCRKESGLDQSCADGGTVFRELTDVVAMVHYVDGGSFQVVEENTYDAILLPCNLPEEFKINKLRVIITGKTFATAQTGICCVERLVLKTIRKQ